MLFLLAFAEKNALPLILCLVILFMGGTIGYQQITIKNLRADVRLLEADVRDAVDTNARQKTLIDLLTAHKELAEKKAAEIARRALRSKMDADARFRDLEKRIQDAATDDDMLPITPPMRAVIDGLSIRPSPDRATPR
jgi:hypothetical protein